jgi:DNA topoisomerase-3
MSKRDGYLEGCGYLVTWAFGHLFSLCDIEHYNPAPEGSGGHWCMENLPCLPTDFHFELRKGADKKVDRGVERQFATIRTLCHRADVDTIVNAGKADIFADEVDIFAENSGELLTKGVGLL